MSELILYQTDDGKAQVKLRAEDGSAWLTQMEIAELFATSKQNVSLHIKNIFAEGELAPTATVKESLTVQTDGRRQMTQLRAAPIHAPELPIDESKLLIQLSRLLPLYF